MALGRFALLYNGDSRVPVDCRIRSIKKDRIVYLYARGPFNSGIIPAWIASETGWIERLKRSGY